MRGDILPPKRPAHVEKRDTPPDAQSATTPIAPQPLAQTERQQAEPALTMPELHHTTSDTGGLPLKVAKKRSKRMIASIVMIIAAIVAAAGVLLANAWYQNQLQAVDKSSDEKVKITIVQGEDVTLIATKLKENGVIRNETAFKWYARQTGKTNLLQAGSYRLGKSEDVPAIVKHLTLGNTDNFSITFLPGATLEQHRQVLVDAGYDEAQVDAALAKSYTSPLFSGKPASADLEGYIYGETYNFAADATPEQILQYVFDYYSSIIEKNNLADLYKTQGFSLYQGITMASIIQREVATPQDAYQVAQVFKKRYDMGMQLGSDVTYQYIADKTGQERRVDFDSPYNTRRYTGLPPGPISSPGLDALKAVGKPAPGDYLYFLSGDDDKTYFGKTNEEHEKNIRDHCEKKCQII